jgi:2-methylcitrate dehydratase
MSTKNDPRDDLVIQTIVDYVYQDHHFHEDATLMRAAQLALLDAMACLAEGLLVPACRRLLGPLVSGTVVPKGARVPGTPYVLDPVKAAFDIGAAIRWLDYNDTWLSKEWGHPSDNLGGILAVSDLIAQEKKQEGQPALALQDVLVAMIKAYEIQGMLAMDNAFNAVGLDHVILVKVATTAVVSPLLGLSRQEALTALSQAWIDGHSLRTYRHAPNVGDRKSWAAGDASARGVFLALLAKKGISPCPSALTAPRWGFQDVCFKQKPIGLSRSLGCQVLPNILFKVSFPAEFHAQTAAEAAFALYPAVRDRWDEIERVEVVTQQPGMDIIVKSGPLKNPADRDHCLQYIVAVALLFGRLSAESYSDAFARDSRIDALRKKMTVRVNPEFHRRYLDPNDRAIPNQLCVFFKDGSATDVVRVDYPLGHPKRRAEALPYLQKKFEDAMRKLFPDRSVEEWEQQWRLPNKALSFLSWLTHFLPKTAG